MGLLLASVILIALVAFLMQLPCPPEHRKPKQKNKKDLTD